MLVVGTIIGGAGLGATLGAAASPLVARLPEEPRTTTIALAVALAAGAAIDLNLAGFGVPTIHRQVAKEWLDEFRGWVYGLGFGLQLGVGFATIVTSATTYVAFAGAALSGSAVRGAAVGGIYGLGRGAVNLLAWNVRRPEQLHRLQAKLARSERLLATPTALSQVAAMAAVVAATFV
jgi:hypothetical protein